MRSKDETNKMYQRMDVKYVIDQYQQNKDLRKNVTKVTTSFLEDFYKDEEGDFWFKNKKE